MAPQLSLSSRGPILQVLSFHLCNLGHEDGNTLCTGVLHRSWTGNQVYPHGKSQSSRHGVRPQDREVRDQTLWLSPLLDLLRPAADKAPSSASSSPTGSDMPRTWGLQQGKRTVCPAVSCSCKPWSAELCAGHMLAHGAAAGALAASVWLSCFVVADWVPLLAVMNVTVEPDETSAAEPPSGWLSRVIVVSCSKLLLTCRSVLRPVGQRHSKQSVCAAFSRDVEKVLLGRDKALHQNPQPLGNYHML